MKNIEEITDSIINDIDMFFYLSRVKSQFSHLCC